MKKLISRGLLSAQFQNSIWAPALRKLVERTCGLYSYSPRFIADFQATPRPYYAYCLLNAADQAKRLGKSRISAIEFGVAGGNGLVYLCNFGREVERATGVAIDCYGFDTGVGMPDPQSHKDLPYWFKASQYRMDEAKLRERVPAAKLVIGDIRDTISDFLERYDPAPIGVIINDTDYWSSTLESFRIFDVSRPHNFLPRIFLYFDDIVGTATEAYGPFNGELAAIDEFNNAQSAVKIHLNQNLLPDTHRPWRFQIYYAHLFDHPLYNSYIGGAHQESLEQGLRLREA